MPGINAEQPMLRGSNDDELHDSKRRRATRHRQRAAATNSSTESRTVGNAADAGETRRSSHAAHKDSEDYVEVSRADDGAVCRADSTHLGLRLASNPNIQAAAIHPVADAPHRKQA